ncbi:MAG: ABC transporter ATP-binding protein [Peptostreptococcaceae bacterium]|nr:ABC transporter ATP-binding protein [Peptostreptococcaceae bacterium]
MNISVQDLDFSFGDQKILENICLNIKKKEFVGLIGPNGSGKSTLLKCIYRTLKPDQGIISLEDRQIQTFTLRETAKMMAVVAQHNETQFDFTVLEMVLLGRSPHKKFMERDNERDYLLAEEALSKVGMSEFKSRSLNSLSGGEKQRIILARALVQETDCLILDEPTNHLDIRYQLQFMSIARELGITVVSAIHDLNIASLYCDKIYALKDGALLACGTPREVLTEENIAALYGVHAKVVRDEEGNLHIMYKKI